MRGEKFIKYLTLTLIAIIVLVSIVFYRSTSSYRSAKKQAVTIAKDLGHIQKVDDFYWFTRQENTFSVVGRDNENVEKIVMIPEKGKEALVINADKGVNQDDAIQSVLKRNETKRIKKVSLGLVEKKPVWEVTAIGNDDHLVYYLVDFYSGDVQDNTLKI